MASNNAIKEISGAEPRAKFSRPFGDDLIAAIVVAVLLVPQSLAYAVLAELPPQMGIYAAILPLFAYALFGFSRQLSVGPTAIVSIMVAGVVMAYPVAERPEVAITLAGMTGAIMLMLSLLRGGFVINFIPRPVVSAYVTGAALLIITSQINHILGIKGEGRTAISMARTLWENASNAKGLTMVLGFGMIFGLMLNKKFTPTLLLRTGLKRSQARIAMRFVPVIFVVVSIILSAIYSLNKTFGVDIVGDIPAGLPMPEMPSLSLKRIESLIVPSCVVAIVAFVDSMTISQTLAAKTRSQTNPNHELLGLGAANIAAAIGGAYPVNGSLSRSAVNVSAGGRTRWVSVFTGVFMILAALFLTPYLSYLPRAILAGLIVAACLSLIDFRQIWRAWQYKRADGLTALLTLLGVLCFGVQWGVLIGVVLAMAFHIKATLEPHMAVVGRIPGTEHYRNVDLYKVETFDTIVTLRIDESLYYANARFLEAKVNEIVKNHPDMEHLIFMCPAINSIDASALDSLFVIMGRLKAQNIKLHFSEMHSFVKERLHRSNFIDRLTGQIFLSHHEAMLALSPEPDWSQYSTHIDMH